MSFGSVKYPVALGALEGGPFEQSYHFDLLGSALSAVHFIPPGLIFYLYCSDGYVTNYSLHVESITTISIGISSIHRTTEGFVETIMFYVIYV